MYLSVVIPAYNEESRIEATLRSTCAYLANKEYEWELLVVLNNCTDNTMGVVSEVIKSYPQIRVIDLGMIPVEKGNSKGMAVINGMREVQGDYVLFMDADNATRIENMEKLFVPLMGSTSGLAIGSRRAKGSVIETPQTLERRILGRAGNWLIQLLVLPGIRDTQCGFKLCTKSTRDVLVHESSAHGWGFDIELLLIAREHDIPIYEIGVTWKDVPNSRIHAKAYFETLLELFSFWKRFRLYDWFSEE
jgi:dolichyl-phosphate beta-glucosyltransferase